MSKITNDHLTRSGTGYFIAVPIGQQWAWKGKTAALSCWRHRCLLLTAVAVVLWAEVGCGDVWGPVVCSCERCQSTGRCGRWAADVCHHWDDGAVPSDWLQRVWTTARQRQSMFTLFQWFCGWNEGRRYLLWNLIVLYMMGWCVIRRYWPRRVYTVSLFSPLVKQWYCGCIWTLYIGSVLHHYIIEVKWAHVSHSWASGGIMFHSCWNVTFWNVYDLQQGHDMIRYDRRV